MKMDRFHELESKILRRTATDAECDEYYRLKEVRATSPTTRLIIEESSRESLECHTQQEI
jgi:hypothetical protein